MIKKLFIFFCFVFLGYFLSISSAFADSKITSSVSMEYSVSTSGNTQVTAHINLTNTTPNYYVSSYSLKLGFPTISNISASDPSGPITPLIKQTDSGQEVTISFNDIVAGQGTTLPFTISFDTPDIATQNGSIWEVNIPGLSNQNDFTDFTTDVVVPRSFGRPTFVKPASAGTNLHFTKDQLGKSGISLAFGSSETYAYSLDYHIQNNNVFPIQTEIALPPTTNYQYVELDSLTPKPNNVTLDVDGNWLAHYTLSPSQKMTVTANGLITVSLQPKQESLTDVQRKMYLEQQPYWQTGSDAISSLAQNLKTPEAIYYYVVSHLTYDFSRVTGNQVRVGAAGILQNPSSAVCLEFTDLFIALARSAGIPAREIDGFGYTQNTISRPLSLSKDILHAWPEYYDDTTRAWIMVDPTWGNTTGGVDYFHTLDFDHVAFVVKGASSSYPVPAGGYKFDNQTDGKDVSVAVSQQEITSLPTISMDVTAPSPFVSGLPVYGSVVLANTGFVIFPSQPISITAQILNPKQQFITTSAIPPLGYLSRSFSFDKTPFLTNTTDTITMTLAGKTIQSRIAIVPFTQKYLILGGIILVILIFILWLIARSSRRLPTS